MKDKKLIRLYYKTAHIDKQLVTPVGANLPDGTKIDRDEGRVDFSPVKKWEGHYYVAFYDGIIGRFGLITQVVTVKGKSTIYTNGNVDFEDITRMNGLLGEEGIILESNL